MQRKHFQYISIGCFLSTLAVPVMAQGILAPHTWMFTLFSLKSLIWLGLAVIFCYLFSCVLASSLVKTQYPPNAARLCIWLGMLFWAFYALFVQPHYVVRMLLPIWFDIAVFAIILLFGAILMFTHRPAA